MNCKSCGSDNIVALCKSCGATAKLTPEAPVRDRVVDRRSLVIRLRDQGLSYRAIGKQLGISQVLARHYCLGVKGINTCKVVGLDGRCYPAKRWKKI